MTTRIAAFVLAFVLPLGLARAERPNSFRLQTAIDGAASTFASVKEDLDSKSAGEVDSALSNLRSTKNEIDRQISEWQSVESRVSSEQSTVDRLRIEWEIAKSQFEQDEQVVRNEQADLERQLANANQSRRGIDGEWIVLNRDTSTYNADVDRYTAAKNAFEARKGTNDDPEYTRLMNWWRASHDTANRLNNRRDDLLRRESSLTSQDSEFRRRLNAIFNGTKLLEKRLALSGKERDYVNARAALERLRGEHNSRAAAINGNLDSAAATANALAASLASIRRVVVSSGVAERTEYTPSSRGAIALPTEDVSVWERPPDSRQALAVGRTYVLPIDPVDRSLAERPVERIRAGALQKVLSKYETKPVEAAPALRHVDSTSLVRSDLPIVVFGEIVTDADPSIDAMFVDLSKPVDPGAFFSTANFRDAKREEARFATLLPKLEAKLHEVSGWRAELYKHQGDLDALREETAKNNIANCLAIAQLGERAEKLAEIPRYAKAFTPAVVQAIKDSESIISATVSAKEGWKSEEMRDKAEKASDTAVEALKLAMNNIPKTDPLYKWADGAIKAHQMLGKGYFLKWREDELKNRSAEEVRADRIMTAVEMIAVINVPAAVGLGIGNEITDWRLNKYYIEPAMEDVSAALSKNFDAEVSLRRQIDRTKSFLEEERRIINAYNASPRRAANSLRGR